MSRMPDHRCFDIMKVIGPASATSQDFFSGLRAPLAGWDILGKWLQKWLYVWKYFRVCTDINCFCFGWLSDGISEYAQLIHWKLAYCMLIWCISIADVIRQPYIDIEYVENICVCVCVCVSVVLFSWLRLWRLVKQHIHLRSCHQFHAEHSLLPVCRQRRNYSLCCVTNTHTAVCRPD